MTKRADKRQFWTVDCETDPFKYGRVPKPFIWGLYTGTSYHEFTEIQELVDFVSNKDIILYAHNGGKFDFHFLLEHINLAEPITVINGRMVVTHIGQCELRDSWNILPIPLSAYKKDGMDYRNMEADQRVKPAIAKKISKYLKGDCTYLWELIDKFEQEYGRHLTLAGAAMAQWKQISGLKAPKSDHEFFQKFEPYYQGGRVQPFQKGVIDGPLKFYDIKSAYPCAMLEEHPYDLDYVECENPTSIRATSAVHLICVSRNCLPHRLDNGRTIYPDDDTPREYHVFGHEIVAGIETGAISQIRYLKSYDFIGQQSFKPYIDHFFAKRQVAIAINDLANDIFCKLFMNALYGKFGANPDNYGNFMCVAFSDVNAYRDENYSFDGMLGPHALLRQPLADWQSHFLNVATAGSITSQVRAKLWRAINNAVDPVYCDTDGLVCKVADLDFGNNLGQWKDEGTADRMWIAGKKMYCAEGDFGKDKQGKPVTSKKASKGVQVSNAKIKLAAMGRTITAYNSAPTFSVKNKKHVTFQKRRIKIT